jgi:hypothetical protein
LSTCNFDFSGCRTSGRRRVFFFNRPMRESGLNTDPDNSRSYYARIPIRKRITSELNPQVEKREKLIRGCFQSRRKSISEWKLVPTIRWC